MNPGVRKLHIMPTLIPSVQNKAMALSSLTFLFSDIHCTPHALAMANAMAESMGLMPRNTPSPTPPNEAWVMPPLMNTNRRLTMYVPTKPHTILASTLPNSAFWKNVYFSISNMSLLNLV